MADLIPATGYVAVFTTLAPDTGRTLYYPRPLLAWTVGDDGHLVGHYVNHGGQTVVASNVPNFHRYMHEDEWPNFSVSHYHARNSVESRTS